mmetsp:Transcript_103693/g.278622  ORF Transcript_103693/g.278622 Transcript_103693/m.278622 type:complete len:423 (-) Transcript_103693:106-1374(-)
MAIGVVGVAALLVVVHIGVLVGAANAGASLPFVTPAVSRARPRLGSPRPVRRVPRPDGATGSGAIASTVVAARRAPIYDFRADAEGAVAKFERIDDVIMGGMSKSALVVSGASDGAAALASWRGLVRTEGGGFCGQRTRPFDKPLDLSGFDGLYISCALASDADAARRVWKLSLRMEESRGEVIYQAQYIPPVGTPEVVYVPFSAFRLVRGPIAVPGAPSISNTSAVFQIGFTCSKFIIDTRMTQLEDFRNGTFQLDIGEIGAFASEASSAEVPASASASTAPPASSTAAEALQAPGALSEREAKKKQPFLVRALLLPLFGLLFSEAGRRRRRAAAILRERGASRADIVAASWRFKRNLRGKGLVSAALLSVGEGLSAAVVGALGLTVKLTIFPVMRLVRRRRERQELRAKGVMGEVKSEKE